MLFFLLLEMENIIWTDSQIKALARGVKLLNTAEREVEKNWDVVYDAEVALLPLSWMQLRDKAKEMIALHYQRMKLFLVKDLPPMTGEMGSQFVAWAAHYEFTTSFFL